jgi:DMSO/TMAO reductase YedYZ molybdopterin-dependent catalytic subunit/DMSO/TMAO reductase YedYZ heme-binding membrane subunit
VGGRHRLQQLLRVRHGQGDPKRNAQAFKAAAVDVKVEGLVAKPGQYQLEDFLKPSQVEDRIYRHRCVEAWSMVVPWRGIPLADVVKRAEPPAKAKFVEFTTLYDPKQMPGQRSRCWSGRTSKACGSTRRCHPLALLATGVYGKDLPNQNGAPLRLVVPWKYGFKGCKSIVRMRFVEGMPRTAWNLAAPHEYGFYSNVNPDVDHPRWSQAPSAASASSGGAHAALQRLRRPGSVAVRGAGSQEELLIAARLRALREPRWFGAALWTLASLPALYAAAALASDILRRTRYFGSNPINEAEHFLGRWALRLLIATLLVTPLRGQLGWQWLGRHRRALGLLAFAYVVLHWLTYVFLDIQLDWQVLKEDLAKRPFIIIGMAGLLLLLPLALTSSAAAVRRLGGRALAQAASTDLRDRRAGRRALLDGREERRQRPAAVRVCVRRLVPVSRRRVVAR